MKLEKGIVIEFIESKLSDLDYKDDNFIYYISTYLKSIENSSILFEYISQIRKAIKLLESRFDNVFLLIESSDLDCVFLEKENRNLCTCLNFLVELLGENDFILDADRLNQIKTKVSLGYDRYFVQDERVVDWFSSRDLDFEIYSKLDIDNDISVLRILDDYLDHQSFIDFEFFTQYLENFPSKIFRNENLKLLEIQKSLFFNEDIDYIDFNIVNGKENLLIKTTNFQEIEIAIKCLELYNLK